jgi:predicted nucleotidyltransferase
VRITTYERIAGYPALQIRQLMRETVGRSITPRYVREILSCTDSGATRVLNRLEKAGFVESVRGYWEATTKGSALAMATAAPPLRRETAERLVRELLGRARLMNADNTWAYRVRMLVLFGSYARGVERPNDIDIGCELHPRWSGEKQQRTEQERRDKRGGRFRNMSEWAAWPKLEVIRYLRASARGLSIHQLDDWIRTTEHTVIFEDVSA